MKRSAIQLGKTYAVVTGSMYEGAEAGAEPAIIVETGVRVENHNHTGRYGWMERRPSSVSNDGVRVQLLDRKTLEPKRAADGFQTVVVKTRNIVALWDEHQESLRLKAERVAATSQRSKDSQEELEAWCARLGIPSYSMPSLSGGIQGGVGWDSEYTRNRMALVKALRAAYDLGAREGSK